MVRNIVAIAGIAFLLLAAPSAFPADRGTKVPRIGLLLSGTPGMYADYVTWFRQGLHSEGLVDERDFALESRFAMKDRSMLPKLAAELVSLKVDVIVAAGVAAVRAAQTQTRTIPIVVGTAGDLVGSGLVASLARPGGNITGMTSLSHELNAKRLELVKEVLPRTTRVAVLYSPVRSSSASLKAMKPAAKALGVDILALALPPPERFEHAFAEMSERRANALMLVVSNPIALHHRRLIELAAKNKIPVFCWSPQLARAGCLMSYGTDRAHLLRRSASFVVKILKGAKPADLPIEQPTKFSLAVNLKVARVLHLTVPKSVLLRADEVIE